MKRMALVLAGLWGGVATPVLAQEWVDPCPPPNVGMDDVNGVVPDFDTNANNPNCHAPDYATPPEGYTGLITPVSSTVVDGDDAHKPSVLPPQLAAPEEVPEEEAGGIHTDYTNQAAVRLGELDALQGRPLNMSYAENLGYLQGYTRGQKTRQGGEAVPVPSGLAPRGFSNF